MTILKICKKCELSYPATEEYFNKCKGTKYGLQSYCRACSNLACMEWGEKNPQHWLSKIGVTSEQYNIMLKSQDNRCMICKKHKDTFKRALHLDHCHTTGQIRDLLCTRCNVGVGMFMHDINLLKEAINYLIKWEKQT